MGWFGASWIGAGDGVLERLLTVTFRNSSRLGSSGLERRETDGFVVCLERMCLELVKNDWGSASFSGENADVLANENAEVLVK